jgi:hypothetical protein
VVDRCKKKASAEQEVLSLLLLRPLEVGGGLVVQGSLGRQERSQQSVFSHENSDNTFLIQEKGLEGPLR